MPARRPKKRSYRTITFKVYEDTDADILDWWEGIDEGERSDALRDLIREHLGQTPRPRRTLAIPELLEVRQDTLWIREALNEMPGYLERLLQYLVAAGAAQPIVQQPANGPPPDQDALSESESQRRARRMKRATW